MSETTRIFQAIEQGDAQAGEQLLPLVYDELRKLAAQRMSSEKPGHTLQPTALVHEVWLKLTGKENVRWDDQAHFFGAAAEAMRRILIDSARRKSAQRHGGGRKRVDFDGLDLAAPDADDKLLLVNDALTKFAAQDPVKAELVKLRYFGGMTTAEAAKVLNISAPTAERYWVFAKAWLHREITRASQ
jgi:RNA polymerase sigma factor (TIGR02999 family)